MVKHASPLKVIYFSQISIVGARLPRLYKKQSRLRFFVGAFSQRDLPKASLWDLREIERPYEPQEKRVIFFLFDLIQ